MLSMSSLFVRTLREVPAEAEVASHQLLLRAGYIRRVAPGIYTWLPLGLRVLRQVEQIVREEMEAIGAQELQFPALLPKEPYEATGRWEEYGDGIFRLKDRKEADYLLGPTHEEMFTLVVKDLFGSYKDLPAWLYQIQTKYRDEARPRAGLLRGREFIMKDSYSFDIDAEGLATSYEAHRNAYIKIFDRLGFEYVIVEATSGAMGGSRSEEFLAKVDIGEDTFVQCSRCEYAANVEAVQVRAAEPRPVVDQPMASQIATPDSATIEKLIEVLNRDYAQEPGPWEASQVLKNVMVMLLHPDGSAEPLAIGLPGDREVDLERLQGQLEPIQVRPMTDVELAEYPMLVPGYIGPDMLGSASAEAGGSGIRYLVDPRIATGTSWVSGANQDEYHRRDLVAGRDFVPDGTIEAAQVIDGDPCPRCESGTLRTARGVEMGHIFQLGQKYAHALDLRVLDADGKLATVTMGSYGIGVSRAVAAIAEGSHDQAGLCWPRAVSPADVHLIVAGNKPELLTAGQEFAAQMSTAGLTVLFDDRPTRPGVKFNDADLIGVPTIVTVGRGLAQGMVEVKDRRSGTREEVAADQLVASLVGSITRDNQPAGG